MSPRISGQTTMWRAGVGFHASHALGVTFFALVYGYLALAEREFLIRSPLLVVLGALLLLGYVVLAKLYWFHRPLAGVALALACYVAGVAMAYARGNNTPRMELCGLPKKRPISCKDCPAFQRFQMSVF